MKLTPHPIEIHTLSHDGRGIGNIEQKTTFVKGALPTEKVHYRILKKSSKYNEAEALDILEASTERMQPPCQHFGVCGGCSLQHMSMNLQIELKQQTLLDQLKHFGKVEPQTILPPLSATTLGYRRKARLGVKFVIKKNKVLVGFREKSSRYLAELTACQVLHPSVGQRLTQLSELISTLDSMQQIPQIEVAIGDEETALVFRHLSPLSEADNMKLIAFAQAFNFHLYLQPNSPEKVNKLWPNDNHDWLSYTLPDYPITYLFHPLDFTQVNLEMNRLMVKQAMGLLAPESNDRVLDLFCGIGNFTLPIAQLAKEVIGVEGSQEMVDKAKQNALYNKITNTQFYAANLMAPHAEMAWLSTSFDKALLDPPRAGAIEILPYLNQLGIKRIVYISCNPATLARDAGELVHQQGYKLKQAGIMNMFPHTSHIEAMALFEK